MLENSIEAMNDAIDFITLSDISDISDQETPNTFVSLVKAEECCDSSISSDNLSLAIYRKSRRQLRTNSNLCTEIKFSGDQPLSDKLEGELKNVEKDNESPIISIKRTSARRIVDLDSN